MTHSKSQPTQKSAMRCASPVANSRLSLTTNSHTNKNQMSNSIPNSPLELIALNEGSKFDIENPNALVELLNEIQEEYEPSPLQGLKAAEQLLEQLYMYHFNMVDNAEENDLTSYQLQMWVDDTKLLKKALLALRQVNT